MNLPPLHYAISDRNSARQDGFAPPMEQARRLAAEGVEFYQLRDKDLLAAELVEMARGLLKCLSGTTTRLLVNHRADVAAAVGAQGVHLTSSPDDLTVRQVNRVYAAAGRLTPQVTISCHSLNDITRFVDEPPSGILFGPVFGKTVAGERVMDGIGLALLREACQRAGAVPVFALGGVTEENTAACVEAGAAGVAGIRLFQRG